MHITMHNFYHSAILSKQKKKKKEEEEVAWLLEDIVTINIL